jgi:hypothetical protein
MQNKKILIIGGTRFIGALFTESVSKTKHNIYLTSRKVSKWIDPENQETIERENLKNGMLYNYKFDCIFDFNGYKPEQIIDFKLKHNNSKYIFISSAWIGRPSIEPEDSKKSSVVGALDSVSYEYTLNKIKCENKIKDIYLDKGLIVRLPIIVGAMDPHQRMQYLIQRLLRNSNIAVPKIMLNRIEFTTDNDVVESLMNIIDLNQSDKTKIEPKKILFDSYLNLLNEIIAVLKTENKFKLMSELDYLSNLPLTSKIDPFWREVTQTRTLKDDNKTFNVIELHEIMKKCMTLVQLDEKYEKAIKEESSYAF